MTKFYCPRFETPANLKARSPYLYPPGTGWPVIPQALGSIFVASYDSQGYGGSIRLRVRSSLYVTAGGGPTENTPFSIFACWFTAADMCLRHRCLATNAARTHRKRRLQLLFYCCMTSQRMWRVPLLRVYGPLPSKGCFSASTVLALSKYATV
jgi:hypothetical protein